MMSFSVLIPVYYKEDPDIFKQAIYSVLEQTVKPSEIVIVKDGPLTPSLEQTISEFEKQNPGLFRIVALEQNAGLGNALAIGITECRYEIIARFDADDINHPERFEKQLSFLEQNPGIDAVGCFIAEFTGTPEHIVSYRKFPTEPDEISAFARFRCPLIHPAVMYRKNAVLNAGNYLPIAQEDYYLFARMLVKGYRFANIPEVLLYMRINDHFFYRRRGKKYILQELKLQRIFLSIGFINIFQFMLNILIRLPVRLIPGKLMILFYKILLRRNKIR